MNQDTIIRLARQAGLLPEANPVMPQLLERFAALVAAHEREACAQVCDGWAQYGIPAIAAAADAIRSRT